MSAPRDAFVVAIELRWGGGAASTGYGRVGGEVVAENAVRLLVTT